jgi:hypothetical protein
MVPVQVAQRHPHLRGEGFDLPQVRPVFEKFVADRGLGSRVSFSGGDFFADPLPPAEVYILGHILHDWGMDAKRALLQRIYDALTDAGSTTPARIAKAGWQIRDSGTPTSSTLSAPNQWLSVSSSRSFRFAPSGWG